jgi:hypothetical protein
VELDVKVLKNKRVRLLLSVTLVSYFIFNGLSILFTNGLQLLQEFLADLFMGIAMNYPPFSRISSDIAGRGIHKTRLKLLL